MSKSLEDLGREYLDNIKEQEKLLEMSNVNGKNLTRVEFASDMPFDEYKACIVPTINTSHSGGTILDSATIESPVTELSTVLERDGTDNAFNRLTDGVYIIKIFVKDAVSDNWSV